MHVDRNGSVFISNWGEDSVIVYDKNKNFVEKLIGDATLSKFAKEFLDVNPEQSSWRKMLNYLKKKRVLKPTGIETNDDFLLQIPVDIGFKFTKTIRIFQNFFTFSA